MNIFTDIKQEARRLFNLQEDAAPEADVISGIHAGIDFSGAKLWILILAIFTASLGLNTNSTAVIIGAMLISPLMGPIIGMGLSVGMNDFETFKRAFRSYLVATIFSVATAVLYWFITPVAETQSELLARTSPTIYDVFIALVGGMAGIIALTSAGQRSGNVIPGVAIATALMPPLCTTGFGIATGQWTYALGAFYLYVINTIFISVATFIGVRIMHFHTKVFVDKQREKRVRNIIYTIVVVTMIPAGVMTYFMAAESVWRQKAVSYADAELQWEGTQVIARTLDYNERSIKVVTIGRELSADDSILAVRRLADYKLEGTTLDIVQGSTGIDMGALNNMIGAREKQNTQMMAQQQNEIKELKDRLAPYEQAEGDALSLGKEMKALFPEVARVGVGRHTTASVSDTVPSYTTTLVVLTLSRPLAADDRQRAEDWLRTRIEGDSIEVLVK